MQTESTAYITISRAAELLGLSPHQTAELAESGLLPSIECDGRLCVSEAAVLARAGQA